MKFESFLLRGLFVVCLFISAAMLGSMLFSTTNAAATPAKGQLETASATALAPLTCPLLPDGILCVRAN